LIVVFDSGIWISAFQFGGTPLIALRTTFIKHEIASCEAILYEIRKALRKKFGWSSERLEGALADYLDRATLIPLPRDFPRICRDPKDDMVIECAVLSGADLIISGDKDLLTLESHRGIGIVTARTFLEIA
jgi:putative PIN family toxin of toxin-antitoxin system